MNTEDGLEPAPENLTPEGRAIVQRLDGVIAALKDFGDKQTEINRSVDNQLKRVDERFTKIDQHLGYLRGAHAANAAQRSADMIADDMGYQIVDLLPREMLIGFVNMARASGKAESDVRSFREADLIMLVRDADGQPAYVAVEASFTVAANDIERAKRNAEYLHEFTGLQTRGAVAGVDIASGQRRNALAVGVHCYTIPVKDLEAD
ncbi:MAG: hypothetical protein OXU28_01220 [Chloroflexota bacterium]|nr:hypothetical protein [Chloroflexota bacterium]